MKTLKFISFLIIAAIALSVFVAPGIALAQDGGQATADKITLSTQYPTIDALATGTFSFSVELNYKGSQDRVFELKVVAPERWSVHITPAYDTSKEISAISMDASTVGTSESLQLTASCTSWPLPDPGKYTITLEASSDDVVGKIDLIANVTAKYGMTAEPPDGIYSTKAKSGHDNTFSMVVGNSGTAPIENITFSASKIQGWEITYTPEKIDTLAVLESKTVDINIKPASKTVTGDYMVTITVSSKQVNAESLPIRVTVETSTVWGWVGVIVIVIVVIGLVLIFMRFGRR
jgi:uncharacterized membrane protein